MRLVNPAGVRNLIVYDWLEPPPVPLPGLPPASSATAELLGAAAAAAAGCDGDESAGGTTGDDGGGGGSRGVKSGRTRQLQRESSGGGASSEGCGGGGGAMAGSMHRSRSTPDVASVAAAAAAAAATEASTSGSPFRYFEDLPPWYCPCSLLLPLYQHVLPLYSAPFIPPPPLLCSLTLVHQRTPSEPLDQSLLLPPSPPAGTARAPSTTRRSYSRAVLRAGICGEHCRWGEGRGGEGRRSRKPLRALQVKEEGLGRGIGERRERKCSFGLFARAWP